MWGREYGGVRRAALPRPSRDCRCGWSGCWPSFTGGQTSFPDTWCHHLCSGANPFFCHVSLDSFFTYFLCPTHNKRCPGSFVFLFARGICGAGVRGGQPTGDAVVGPAGGISCPWARILRCRSWRKSWSGTRAAASNAGWVGPLTPSLFGKGLAQTSVRTAAESIVLLEAGELAVGAWRTEVAPRWHISSFFFLLLF